MNNLLRVAGLLASAFAGSLILAFVVIPTLLIVPAFLLMIIWGAFAGGLGWATIGYGTAFFAAWLLVIAGALFNSSSGGK